MIQKTDPNNFDLIRNLLAFLVFFTHWNILTTVNNESFIFHLSGIAIDAFFVVSGFLIWWSFSSDQSVVNFYIKRAFRILPLYLIVVCLQTFLFAVFSDGNLQSSLDIFLLTPSF